MLSKLIFHLSQPWLALRDWLVPARDPQPPVGEFVKGINFGGAAVAIAGDRWHSYADALATGLSTPGATAAQTYKIPRPYASRGTRTMLNTVVFRTQTLALEQTLPNGHYHVYLWVMENYQTNWHSLTLTVAGAAIAQEIGQLPLNSWLRYGPYPVTVADGHLRLSLNTGQPDIDAHLMGLSIFKPV